MRLIPALDLRHGQVVRLAQGDDERRTRYDLTPADVLASYAEAGVDLVHVVDLDAAFGEAPQRALIAELAALGSPRVELGGGLRDAEAVAWALGTGCERVVLGSLVSRDFAAFAALAEAHPGRIVPALEVGRDAEGRSVLRIAGWRESVATPVDEMSRRLRGLPCPAVLVTDIDRDGTLSGPNLELARSIALWSGIPALLSGGVRSLDDLRRAAQVAEIAGAIVGKALYDGVFSLADAMAACGQAQAPLTDLTCRVIPCLDVKDGRVVKGVRFQNLVDQGDPAEAARRYAEEGADELVFLDITAAPDRRDTDLEWVRRTAEQVFIPLTVGGGVRRVEDAERLLLAGADKVAINSAAIADPDLLDRLARRFGSQCVVLSVDALRRTGAEPSWQVVTHGGRRPHDRDVLAWIAEGVERGAGEILLTSIDSDGTQDGYDLELLRAARARVTVPIIASGGAGEPRHLADALAAGADAVLAASIFHQGSHPIPEVKRFLAAEGFPIRPEEP